MITIPLIFTTEGNLPVSELELKVDWDITEESVVFTESYFLNNELVRQSKHVKLLKTSSELAAIQGTI